MGPYIYVLFFALGPIYWLPNVAPQLMLSIKTLLFLIIFLRLILTWIHAGFKIRRAPFLWLFFAICAMLASTLAHGNQTENLLAIGNYIFPLLLVAIIPTLPPKHHQEIASGLQHAPVVFAIFAILIPLGLIFPSFNWVNPFSEELTGFEGTQTFTGFGGSRTGWSLGASLIAASAFTNCVIAKGAQKRWAALVLLIIGSATFIPGGRVGMLSFLAMFVTLILLSLLRRSTVKSGIWWSLFLAATVLLSLSFAEDLRLDTLLSGDLAEGSTGRAQGWVAGIQIFSENPVFGVGEDVAARLGQSQGYGSIHNSVINYLAKFGIFGTLPMLLFFGWIATRLFYLRAIAIQNRLVLVAILMFGSVCAAVLAEPFVVFASFFNVVIFWFSVSVFFGLTPPKKHLLPSGQLSSSSNSG